jgi:hypothetical protein
LAILPNDHHFVNSNAALKAMFRAGVSPQIKPLSQSLYTTIRVAEHG